MVEIFKDNYCRKTFHMESNVVTQAGWQKGR